MGARKRKRRRNEKGEEGRLSSLPDKDKGDQFSSLPDKDKEDRLSSLPDDIIANILPLLPIKKAVATAVLAQRWRIAWTQMNYINIHHLINTGYFYTTFLQANFFSKLATKNMRICFRDYRPEYSSLINPWLAHLSDWRLLDIHLEKSPHSDNTPSITTPFPSSVSGLSHDRTYYLRSLQLVRVKPPSFPSSTRSSKRMLFPNLTYIRLDWNSYDCQEVHRLLEASPALELLVLKFRDFKGFEAPTSEVVPTLKLPHLKRLELHISQTICFGDAQDVSNFIKYILASTPALERIVFKYSSFLGRRGKKETLFRKQIQDCPRSSPGCKFEYFGKYNKLLGLGTQCVNFW